MARKIIKYTNHQSIRISEPKTLNSVLMRSFDDLNMAQKMQENMIKHYWNELFGQSIISATKKITYTNQNITITFSSSIVRQELYLMKDVLLEQFQQKFGKDKIKQIYMY